MSGSLNKVMVIGNLTADPDIRTTGSGMAVGDLRVATNRSYKKDDEWVEEVEYHSVTIWGSTAENCGKYLSKGKKVFVEGRLKTEKWQDKDGNDRWTTKIVADVVQFLSPADGASREPEQAREGRGRGPDRAREPEQRGRREEPRQERGRDDRGRDDRGRGNGSAKRDDW